jgi:DNA-binding response OmpR family regulator
MSDRPRLLVVEDETSLATGLKLNLEIEGFGVDVAGTGREAAAALLEREYAVIILDVMLPDMTGFDFCRSLREAGNYTPVLMLTVRNSAEDRVAGLEAGADDYLAKPFNLPELLARVRSALRRRDWDRTPGRRANLRLRIGGTLINLETHTAHADGQALQLTQLEFDLLRYFAEHPGRIIRREELLEKVWKLRDYSDTRTVDNFIVRLRRYFEPDPAHPVHFISVRGRGYKFVPGSS